MNEHIFQNKLYYRKNDFLASRPTLVFIHGISGSSSAWLSYENKFKSTCNILTFDLRGHGKSEKPKGESEYAIKKFSDDLFELLNFLKIENIVLISHSFGGLVALEFLQEHFNLVKQIVFLSPNPRPAKILGAIILKPLLKLTPLLDMFPFRENGKTHIDYSRYLNSGDWNIPRMIADVGNTGLRVYLWGTKKSYEVDYENILEKINIPTLIMHGRRDTIFPFTRAMQMHKKIKNSQFIQLENANHILVLNFFPEVSSAIEKFINLPSS